MDKVRIGFIGTGKKPEKPSAMGYGMAHQHALAYQALKSTVEIVACADIAKENAEAFAGTFGIPKTAVYTNYNDMLAKENLDVVSICTWPNLHEAMAVAAAKAHVKGIYCEKPMAYTWGASRRMHAAAIENGVALCFNHQRRFGKPFRMARQLIEEGVIGKLERVEFGAGNLYDYGTHNFDLSNYLAGEQRAKWILAQIDYRDLNLVFGAHNENQSIAQWEYENGVLGFCATGLGARMIDSHNRIVGSAGTIEIGSNDPVANKRPLRFRKYGMSDWEYLDTAGENCHGPGYIDRAIADFINCLTTGRACELNSAHALNATELCFGAYHSSRIHGRVDFPLTIDDNPLVSMLDSGAIKPQKRP